MCCGVLQYILLAAAIYWCHYDYMCVLLLLADLCYCATGDATIAMLTGCSVHIDGLTGSLVSCSTMVSAVSAYGQQAVS